MSVKEIYGDPDRWYFRMPASYEKFFYICGPMWLSVDYDDVNHEEVIHNTKRVVDDLNRVWRDDEPV